MEPDANQVETERRAEKLDRMLSALKQYNIGASDVAMILPQNEENEKLWEKLSQAVHINLPSHKTRVRLVQAMRELEMGRIPNLH